MKKSGSTTWLFFLLVTLFFAGFLLVKKNNVIRWVQANHTIRNQERLILDYQKKIDGLDRQLQDLSTNRDTLETFARENFNFAAEGDDVYLER